MKRYEEDSEKGVDQGETLWRRQWKGGRSG